VADEHKLKCLQAGVKISGINAEVMPGQWEFQIGPCRGIEIGDHMTIARYIMLRVTEQQGVVVTFDPKPMQGNWNGAGCHTNFSVTPMLKDGGYDVILKVCEAFGQVAKEHIQEYGDGNEKRLTGLHETCDINTFKYGVANRGASIRIPREAERDGKGYMEDRRPAANACPYRVTCRMMKTTGACLGAGSMDQEVADLKKTVQSLVAGQEESRLMLSQILSKLGSAATVGSSAPIAAPIGTSQRSVTITSAVAPVVGSVGITSPITSPSRNYQTAQLLSGVTPTSRVATATSYATTTKRTLSPTTEKITAAPTRQGVSTVQPTSSRVIRQGGYTSRQI
jgi:hypothetical protein